jgi:hypothetical protein
MFTRSPSADDGDLYLGGYNTWEGRDGGIKQETVGSRSSNGDRTAPWRLGICRCEFAAAERELIADNGNQGSASSGQ